jgi:RimJ/RimL family protein N-acetyltransferase
MEIRLLQPEDGEALRALRLRSLRDHPEAFATAFEEEEQRTVEQFADQVRNGPPNNFTLGAFEGDQLLGIGSLNRFPRLKTRHRAMINGMYVVPEARGKGVGKAILDALIAYARTLDGLADITLAVTAGNTPARALYAHAGFRPFGIEPRYIHIAERYYDIEWLILYL